MADLKFVSAYAVTRNYGGPEEGGWWYNWYELLQTVPCDPEDAPRIQEHLLMRHSEVKQGNIYSVLGGVDLAVYIEEEPGLHETKERPHYS